ncbi:hypothetical protein QZM35_23180 [Burkholderia sp. AU45274]|uniref:hypothetical protein n=1 Tax=Burkholderia sp. AU45274 TaxID=3059205 RepID=UPI00264FD634|nr:hypothetical protein [Burkholderia sp. AU45274]MDN7490619.1 hypothetical protein [Burkholderia sp. AU45274]
MTDKELLEHAAKAAKFDFVPSKDGGIGWIGGILHKPWNPLRDDGDALRLAVKMKMDIVIGQSVKVVCVINDHNVSRVILPLDEDPYATTRRAIVMAAAGIEG